MTVKDIIVSKRPNLAELARQINSQHAWEVRAVRQALEHACRSGELLLEAKKMCSRGEWETWLETNVHYSPRTAQDRMFLARNKAKLEAEKTATGRGFLGVRAALEFLRGPAEGPDEPLTEPPPPRVEVREAPPDRSVKVRAVSVPEVPHAEPREVIIRRQEPRGEPREVVSGTDVESLYAVALRAALRLSPDDRKRLVQEITEAK
jgi:hypothetical protein